jgi:hypothetical protein
MRRFSTALVAAILLSSATGFAFDEWNCEGKTNDAMDLVGLACVSCGVQKHYRSAGKGEVIPSKQYLAMLAVGARQFRQLNPGAKSERDGNPARNPTAKMNLQKTVISQVQAYGFCTKKTPVKWRYVNDFITDGRDRSKDQITDLAKSWGFKKGILSSTPSYDNFHRLVDDSALISVPIEEKRRAFRENSKELIDRGDVDGDLLECLSEVKNRAETEKPTDPQSYALCTSMASECGIESDFCRTFKMVLPVQGGTSKNPAPAPVSSGSNQRLAPPPPASVPVK